MGKGDRKTKRGKINIGSYGVRRPKKKKKCSKTIPQPKTTPKAETKAPKKKTKKAE